MIGDALETDVVGGNNAGIDVLWVVQDGIHSVDVRTKGVMVRWNCLIEKNNALMPMVKRHHLAT